MIKNILLGFLFFTICNSFFAQNKTREEVIQLIADDTCECIKNDKTSFTKDKSMNKKEIALGLCMLNSYNLRKLESKAFKNSGLDDFEAIGEDVGLKMVTTCGTEFMNIFSDDQLVDLVNDYEDDVPPLPPSPKTELDLSMEAELISLSNDVISYFQVSDSFEKTHTFLINEQFEGFELLTKSNFKRTFMIYYKELDFFDLSERRYVKKKVVKYLELIN